MLASVLVIGDTHIPFEHKDYLSFCKRIHKFYRCTEVVHVGDLVDNNAISYHEYDPDGWSPADEMREADKHLRGWFKTFPKLKLCRGNHDRLVDRKGKTIGLPRRCFREYRDIWTLPDGWVDDFQFTIGDVVYQHLCKSGPQGYFLSAKANLMSTVSGHAHSTAGVMWGATERNVYFGLGVGCGIDRKRYAFSYGKDLPNKPILGCGVVSYTKHGTNAQFFPMQLC